MAESSYELLKPLSVKLFWREEREPAASKAPRTMDDGRQRMEDRQWMRDADDVPGDGDGEAGGEEVAATGARGLLWKFQVLWDWERR